MIAFIRAAVMFNQIIERPAIENAVVRALLAHPERLLFGLLCLEFSRKD